MRIRTLVFGLCSAVLAAIANAGPVVNFQLTLTVESVQNDQFCGNPFANFGCIAVGSTHTGIYTFEESLLATDGIRLLPVGSAFGFTLRFGNAIYSNDSTNTTLSGFRDHIGFGLAPSLVVQNGDLVDISGGVYGLSDTPYVDFRSYTAAGPNTFRALDGNMAVTGSLAVMRVPEPTSVLLAAMALAICALIVRAREQATVQR